MSFKKSTPNEFRVLFKQSAYDEFKRLDGSVKRKVAAQLLKIQHNPMVGEGLGNKMGVNLAGYRKIYVDNKQIRIVWAIESDKLIVTIVGIGKRDKGEIYKIVARRLLERAVDPSDPSTKEDE